MSGQTTIADLARRAGTGRFGSPTGDAERLDDRRLLRRVPRPVRLRASGAPRPAGGYHDRRPEYPRHATGQPCERQNDQEHVYHADTRPPASAAVKVATAMSAIPDRLAAKPRRIGAASVGACQSVKPLGLSGAHFVSPGVGAGGVALGASGLGCSAVLGLSPPRPARRTVPEMTTTTRVSAPIARLVRLVRRLVRLLNLRWTIEALPCARYHDERCVRSLSAVWRRCGWATIARRPVITCRWWSVLMMSPQPECVPGWRRRGKSRARWGSAFSGSCQFERSH